jgi:hypothetical protein
MLVQINYVLELPIIGALVMERLKADTSVNSFLLGEPEAISWTNLTEWGVQMRVMAKTQPGKQWAVSRMLADGKISANAIGQAALLPVRWRWPKTFLLNGGMIAGMQWSRAM